MVSYNVFTTYQDGLQYVEGNCLSTDTKPTENIANGSKLLEMDTSILYNFDAENQEWRPWE